jgi:hypothetical protein
MSNSIPAEFPANVTDGRDDEVWTTFLHSIVDDPTILDDIPNGSTVVLIPDDDPELAELNLQSGLDSARRGADVYIRHIRLSETR